jgi:DNA-binding Xre family transcriptional regulator/GTPase SAR1 family protein
MPRLPGHRRSAASKITVEQALEIKGLKPRDDIRIIEALEQSEVFIAAKTWQRFWEGKQNIDRSTFKNICQFLEINWQDIIEPRQNINRWDLIPADPNFYGRTEELQQLKIWTTNPNCRLIMLYGLDGIGKSSLVSQLIKQVSFSFQRVEWKTFSYGDAVESTLSDLLQQLDPQNLFDNLNYQQLNERLWQELQQRCLIILEQEQDGDTDNFDNYKQLLRKLLQTHGKSHYSCILLVTSYEKPDDVTAVANHNDAAKSLHLSGVDVKTGLEIIKNKEPKLVKNLEVASDLVTRFGGYPLALKLVSSYIRDQYNGDVQAFLNNIYIPQSIEDIITGLIDDLDQPALVILDILKDSEPMSQPQLQAACHEQIQSDLDFIRAKDILERRSLLTRYEGNTEDGREFLFGLEQVTKHVLLC